MKIIVITIIFFVLLGYVMYEVYQCDEERSEEDSKKLRDEQEQRINEKRNQIEEMERNLLNR